MIWLLKNEEQVCFSGNVLPPIKVQGAVRTRGSSDIWQLPIQNKIEFD